MARLAFRARCRRFAGILVVTSVALLACAGTASAKQRCCLKVTITSDGFVQGNFGGSSSLSPRTIGSDSGRWNWTQRMILVYEEDSRGTSGRFRLARLGGKPVAASTVFTSTTESSVQFEQPDGSYAPFARPLDCGTFGSKWRRGDVLAVQRARFARPGARARYPNARYFLDAGLQVAFENGESCLYGGRLVTIDDWEDQPCVGQGGFSLPAPRSGWFRRGSGRIEKTAECFGGHYQPSNDRTESSGGLGTIVLEWFPPSRLSELARRLKKAHRAAGGPSQG